MGGSNKCKAGLPAHRALPPRGRSSTQISETELSYRKGRATVILLPLRPHRAAEQTVIPGLCKVVHPLDSPSVPLPSPVWLHMLISPRRVSYLGPLSSEKPLPAAVINRISTIRHRKWAPSLPPQPSLRPGQQSVHSCIQLASLP